MSEVVVVATFKAQAGKEEDARAALESLVASTHSEAGCILYAMHQGIDDPARFGFVERWASREHLEGHNGSAHVADLIAHLDELFTEPPDVVVCEPRPAGDAGKGALVA